VCGRKKPAPRSTLISTLISEEAATMPELRKDPIVGRWVIIAHERAKRPHDFKGEMQKHVEGGLCPFCEGNEDKTPPEIIAYRDRGTRANGPGWRIRVVPNKFPALQIEGNLNKRGDGIYDKMAGVGAHEVIIESPRHEISMASLSEESIREVLWVYRDRLVDLKKDSRLVHGMLFKNVGAAGGATLEHTHSQLIVTPIIPISVWEEMTGALEFYNYRGRCIFCDMFLQEQTSEKRIVLDTPHFTAFCPYASRFPFETWILPKSHSSHFENIPKPGVDDLGSVLRQVLNKLEVALDSPAYNYIIHTAPFDHQELPHYHWHIEIIPRLTKVAGFEWGSGFYINPVPPEDAAAFLREVETSTAAPLRVATERLRTEYA
jgi:UDPglucose--hexose-1-phosphate uridylyltransferase